MKRFSLLCTICLTVLGFGSVAVAETFDSCGPGYILVSAGKVDGIPTYECQKLWCRDLENGKYMGTKTAAASGYYDTGAPVELCDNQNNCVECFGERRWCSGEAAGVWNPEYGAYTRGGEDNSTYYSYQKGNCFAWRVEKPNCPEGQTAVLRDGAWVCATSTGTTEASRASSVRRTGTLRRVIR